MVIYGSLGEGVEDTEKLLANQHSSALLPFHEQQLNEQKKYYYDVSGKIEFKSYVEHQSVGQEAVKQLIVFILELYRTMEEYLLDPDAVLLEAEYLYMDMAENTLSAACIPGRKENFNTQLKLLASWLLENADHTDREGVLLVYDFYKIVQRPDFLPVHLQKFESKKVQKLQAREIRKESVETKAVEQTVEQDPFVIQVDTSQGKEKKDKKEKKEKREKRKETVSEKEQEPGKWFIVAAAGFLLMIAGGYKVGLIEKLLGYAGTAIPPEYAAGGLAAVIVLVTVIYYIYSALRRKKGSIQKSKEKPKVKAYKQNVYNYRDVEAEKESGFTEEKTVVLSGTEGSVRLISMNKHAAPDLILTEFPCTVGSAKERGQHTISVEGISRKHAVFEKRSDGVYLMDLHSTNGTKVNGEFLEDDEQRRLMAEDIIEFASVRFMYCQ